MSERPRFIIRTQDVAEREHHYSGSDEPMRFDRDVGRAAGLQRIGLHLVRLLPGRRTSYPHCEENEEEFIYVLEGEVDAWVDGELWRMRAGDLAAFPAGTGVVHTFINDGAAEALLLVGGEADRDDNRIFYPFHPERRQVKGDAHWWGDAPVRLKGAHDGQPRKR